MNDQPRMTLFGALFRVSLIALLVRGVRSLFARCPTCGQRPRSWVNRRLFGN